LKLSDSPTDQIPGGLAVDGRLVKQSEGSQVHGDFARLRDLYAGGTALKLRSMRWFLSTLEFDGFDHVTMSPTLLR
jgi:hypothetical protein